MPKTIKTRSGRVLVLPTLAEDATVANGTKRQITLRLDADLIDTFKASGDGWQTRINAVLRDAVAHGLVKAG